MGKGRSPRDHIATVVAAHGELTNTVADAARLMHVNAHAEFGAHLDEHRAELNVAVGDLALWLDSFGEWDHVDPGVGIRATRAADVGPSREPFGAQLLIARETLKTRRAHVLSELGVARSALHSAGLPAGEVTAYRRMIRLWAGEAIDVVAAVHRLTLADSYIRRLGRLTAGSDQTLRRDGTELLGQWMRELEAADRDGELALAETCGYGELVRRYRTSASPR